MSKKTKKKVPELRFPEFSGDWITENLSEISSIKTGPFGSQLKNEQYVTGGTPVVTVEHIKSFQINEFDYPSVTKTDKNRLKNYILKSGDIVFSRVGSVDLSACVEELQEGWLFSSRMLRVRPDQHLIKSKFLAYFLQQLKTRRYIIRISVGSTMPSLNTEILQSLEITYPKELESEKISEQEKIAHFLGAVDARLDQLRRKHELLQTYKRGVMQKLFSQQIRFKQDDGSPFPDWQRKDFGDIVSRVSSKYDPRVDESSYPCVELESIASNEGRLIKVFNSKEQQSIKIKFKSQDILFGKLRPYLRKFMLANFDGVCSTEIWVFRGKRISSSYLYYLVQGNKFSKVSNVTFGSKMPRSDWDFISAFPFDFPHKEEQEKIANFLTTIDRKIEALSRQIEQVEQFKKGLLQKLFV